MNPSITIRNTEILSDNWYVLKKITFDYKPQHGPVQTQQREAYDRGNGATILLYNRSLQTIILTRQFRLPTFINGNENGMLIEACAGLLDKDNPEDCIRRETEEETGYRIGKVEKVYEAYMSPGSVTEMLYFFVAEYNQDMLKGAGGGHPDEDENIEVMEIKFQDAVAMVKNREIKDAKTIMLIQHAQINDLLGTK